jgi:hypothetical protein
MEFRQFLESEEQKNIKTTLNKLPKAHKALVKGYKYSFQGGNTMKGDDEHIGEVDPNTKKIVVAAPWNYGREFTILHEIGHMVYETLTPKQKKQWAKITKNTEKKQKQTPEELFCMAYANTYAKHKIEIHNHEEWGKFIRAL